MDHAQHTSRQPGLGRFPTRSSSSARLRVASWQGSRYTALVGPHRQGPNPTVADVTDGLNRLHRRGVQRAVTPALSPPDCDAFFAAGFELHERLHLLAYPLTEPPPTPTRRIQHARPWHRQSVLAIDALAFEPFWQFDAVTLREARRATPSSYFRLSKQSGKVTGYAVTGKAAHRGYLQRLAVDPANSGAGHGSALVHDSLHWLHGRGVSTVLVNTQERNRRALALYQRLGFITQPEGLLVLRWERKP